MYDVYMTYFWYWKSNPLTFSQDPVDYFPFFECYT